MSLLSGYAEHESTNHPARKILIKNILLIKLRYIGDVLLSTPIISLLTRHLSGVKISFLVNAGTGAILSGDHRLQEIFEYPRGSTWSQIQFLRLLRSRQYDCVVDLSDGDRAAFISRMSGAPLRIGFNHEKRLRGKLYTDCVAASYGAMHMVEYHVKALECLGIDDVPGHPELFISEEAEHAALGLLETLGIGKQPWVMIHPAARYWFKAWPADRFAALADVFHERGVRVVLVGSRNEHSVETEILQAAKRPLSSLVGKTSLLQLASLMKHCCLFVGNDAGPMHMAAAVGCPVVALFGPSNPAVWGPRGKYTKTIYKGLDCRECFHPGCSRGKQSCMNLITVPEVMQAAEEFL